MCCFGHIDKEIEFNRWHGLQADTTRSPSVRPTIFCDRWATTRSAPKPGARRLGGYGDRQSLVAAYTAAGQFVKNDKGRMMYLFFRATLMIWKGVEVERKTVVDIGHRQDLRVGVQIVFSVGEDVSARLETTLQAVERMEERIGKFIVRRRLPIGMTNWEEVVIVFLRLG